MLAHEVDRGAVNYAALPAHSATWEDLDPLEFRRVRRLVTETATGRIRYSRVYRTQRSLVRWGWCATTPR